jgi:hypothetical protein
MLPLCIAAYAFLVAERAASPRKRVAALSAKCLAPGRCQSVPNATSRIQLNSARCASLPYSTDAHAAPNLGQIDKIDDMFDEVGLMTLRIFLGLRCVPINSRMVRPITRLVDAQTFSGWKAMRCARKNAQNFIP